MLTVIGIAMNNQAKSIVKNTQTDASCTADNKFKLPAEAVEYTTAMKMHAIKLWNLKSFANNFTSKRDRNKRSSNVRRFDKALQVLKSFENNKRACDISNLSLL